MITANRPRPGVDFAAQNRRPVGAINSYTKQRIEKALENYYEPEFKNRKLLWS